MQNHLISLVITRFRFYMLVRRNKWRFTFILDSVHLLNDTIDIHIETKQQVSIENSYVELAFMVDN